MKATRVASPAARGTGEICRILFEGLLVAAVGAALAFAANALSPRGLALTRNYFPRANPTPVSTTVGGTPAAHSQPTGSPRTSAPATNPLAARLEAQGLQLIASNQVVSLFHDPRYRQELVVFIDARNDEEYAKGHVPGAYQFDRYHAENYLPGVLPVCQTADQIVVYCNGGDCEDGEFAATTLNNAGIPATRLFVYAGGLTEWAANGLPIETGARLSGNLRHASP